MQHKRIFIALIILLVMTVTSVLMAEAQDSVATISLLTDVQHISAGQEFTARIAVAHATKIYGVSFKLSYDPQTFEVVQSDNTVVTAGAFFSNKPSFTVKNAVEEATGNIDYGLTLMLPAEPVSGDGILGTVTFRALKDAPAAIEVVQANLVSPEFSEVNGHMVAQRVDQVPAQIISSSASTQGNATAMFSNPALNARPGTQQALQSQIDPRRSIPLIAAGMFFVAGLVLLTLSVGLYSRMRVRSNLMALKEIQPEQVY